MEPQMNADEHRKTIPQRPLRTQRKKTKNSVISVFQW